MNRMRRIKEKELADNTTALNRIKRRTVRIPSTSAEAVYLDFVDGTEAPSIVSVNAMWTSCDNKQYNMKFEVIIGSS